MNDIVILIGLFAVGAVFAALFIRTHIFRVVTILIVLAALLKAVVIGGEDGMGMFLLFQYGIDFVLSVPKHATSFFAGFATTNVFMHWWLHRSTKEP